MVGGSSTANPVAAAAVGLVVVPAVTLAVVVFAALALVAAFVFLAVTGCLMMLALLGVGCVVQYHLPLASAQLCPSLAVV